MNVWDLLIHFFEEKGYSNIGDEAAKTAMSSMVPNDAYYLLSGPRIKLVGDFNSSSKQLKIWNHNGANTVIDYFPNLGKVRMIHGSMWGTYSDDVNIHDPDALDKIWKWVESHGNFD